MTQSRKQPVSVRGNHTLRSHKNKHRDARTKLRYELLEPRMMLASDLDVGFLAGVQASAAQTQPIPTQSTEGSTPTNAPITWFETFNNVPRIALKSLSSVDQSLPANVAGPQALSVGEWIVQLNDAPSQRIDQLANVEALLTDNNNQFTIVSGLGDKGLILVRGVGISKADIEASLAQNPNVASFSLNQLITGQVTTPNDTDFVRGAMPSLTTIGAPSAWDVSRGNLTTVVGVLDTGIDLAHRDLYLNIWFNQGEIPSRFLDNVGNKLVDIDSDGLITFYDLNHVTRAATSPYSLTFGGFANGPNAEFVNDLNGNGYIDGLDILADPLWADGRDTDGNGEVDDFFGVNFRGGGVRNLPMDQQGHGTHVAGTIGAIGGNGAGVTGINWSTSLMALRILDDQNQGDTGSAIAAVNYARNMRDRYRINSVGRITGGANVRVLNNSWGQPGGFESSLETAIQESGETGILFVAASGNGNFLGQAVDNDRTPFYPAGYDSLNVIAVASSNSTDSLASSSNFGAQSVDLAAPGTGIRSTELGGGYGTRNGTSMATPHVAGTAALVWSAFPEATVAEVRQAILSTVDPIAALAGKVKTGGRLNSGAAMSANVFAPAARLISKQDITRINGTTATFRVEYSHRGGMSLPSINGDDLVATRQWGPAENVAIRLSSKVVNPSGSVTATYIVTAPGGTWDALDFGDYLITTQAGKVAAADGSLIQQRDIGKFNVRINNSALVTNSDPTVLYASTFTDQLGTGSLRDAIIAANAAGAPRTIILDSGTYNIGIPSVPDPASTFPQPPPDSRASTAVTGWSNATTGDFDITGSVTIVGNQNDFTVIDGTSLDRVFKVHPGARLELQRVTVTGGQSPPDQGGGGILSAGELTLRGSNIIGNQALGSSLVNPIAGGGIAAWNGRVDVLQSWIDGNESNFGAGLFVSRLATIHVSQSTVSNNQGGGVDSRSSIDGSVTNSTFSANFGGNGAVLNGRNPNNLSSVNASLSADGRFVAFQSDANNLVLGDSNGTTDVFVYDRVTDTIERVSIATDGTQANFRSLNTSLSADGRFVAFQSDANNLVSGDINGTTDVFVYDRITDTIERVSIATDGTQANSSSSFPSLSADGRFVAFVSDASNLVPGDTNGTGDVFVYGRDSDTIERVSVAVGGIQGTGRSFDPSMSADGRFVAFASEASNLVPGDTNGNRDVFVYDRNNYMIERITQFSFNNSTSLSADGRYVAFASDDNSLVLGDTNGRDVFVYDRDTDTFERVSVATDGTQSNGFSEGPSLSADGRFVAFTSNASNLVPGDTNPLFQEMFVYDRDSDTIERVSAADSGTQSNGQSLNPTLSADGRFLAFQADASNLVSGDINGFGDVFVYDRDTEKASLVPDLPNSILNAYQLSVVGTLGASFAVNGRVDLKDSFLSNGSVLNVSNSVLVTNVVQNPMAGISRIAGLVRAGFAPPVHALLSGNPAIDAGSNEFQNTTDQRGVERSTNPDVGAVETVNATVAGTVFIDLDNDQQRDTDEPLVPNVSISVQTPTEVISIVTDSIGNFVSQGIDPGQDVTSVALPQKFTAPGPEIRKLPSLATNGASSNASLSADGRFIAFESTASNLVSGDTNGTKDVFIYDRIGDTIERVSIAGGGIQANSESSNPSLSADGRYVAFESIASNLVPGDTNNRSDVFVYDRESDTIERVSVAGSGTQAIDRSLNPSLSADGQFVAFQSDAGNLVPGDTNGTTDIFVYDRIGDTVERVSVATGGIQANSFSLVPSLSANGRFVAFASRASNLVSANTYVDDDVFVYDRDSDTIELVSVNAQGTRPNGSSFSPSLSADGRFVAYRSDASNLVPGDTNDAADIFVYDRDRNRVKRASVDAGGAQANLTSIDPSLSADGRFVAFVSGASNLVSGDTNGTRDLFIYDLNSDTIERVSMAAGGTPANNESLIPSLSADGRFVAFNSFATNLVEDDNNLVSDIFFTANPLADFSQVQLNLVPGDAITDLNFGLVPDQGTISGRLFNDTAILNGVYDLGESVLPGRTVFVDANLNGVLDTSERTAVTNASGIYQFTNLPSFRNYVLRTINATGFEQVTPRSGSDTAFNIFLPAGGVLAELDFGFRPISTTGQSSDSTIRGRVMTDSNGSGSVDAGDTPASGRVVYLDGGTLGLRDFNDPQTVTDANGNYSFPGLPSTLSPVRLLLDDSLLQVTPLGNDLLGNDSQPLKFPLGDKEQRGGNPQSVVTGDFNADGFADVAVVLGESNKLSVRLNDKLGGFTSQKFDFNLSDFAITLNPANRFNAPIALVADQLDANPKPDFAIAGNFTGNVLVLMNFDSVTGTFGSKALLSVGQEPIDIVSGQFAGNSALDLVVLNRFAGTVQVLTNNGSGIFTVGAPVVTGGESPVSLAVGNFIGSSALDIAVTHAVPKTTTTTAGGVTVLAGNGIGGFAYNGNYYSVQATPLDSAVGDFNRDGRPDLAVVNFSSNSISILLGQADGTLRVQSTSLGTANGAINVAIADINNDGQMDVITTKLAQRQVSIFRNSGVNSTTGEVGFEPQENIGLGQFQFGEQMPFAIANLDNDTSGPGGTGTLDIVAIPQNTDTLYVLPNRLVQGSRRVSVSGASTDIASGIDFLVAPKPVFYSIAATSAVKAEGNSLASPTPFTFTVTRSGLTTGITNVNYAVIGSTANRAVASDFAGGVLPSGTVTFPAGVTSRVITINVVGDSVVEPSEGFVVRLSSPSSNGTITTAAASASIRNDDTSYAIAAVSAVKAEGHSLITPTRYTFQVTRSGIISGITTVNYAVTGSAVNGAVARDFLGNALPSGTVTFAPGVTTQLVTVNVLGDTVVELNEGFVVTLSAPSSPGSITTAVARGTIQNDDTSYAIAATSAVKVERNSSSTPYTFTVTRSGLTTGITTVKYSVAGSTVNRANSADFAGNVLPSGTITFAAGVTRQVVTINVLGDTAVEPDEGFIVTLSAPSSPGTVTTAVAAGTIQNDDAASASSSGGLQAVRVITQASDQMPVGNGWRFGGIEHVDGQSLQTFRNSQEIINLVGPLSWTNPLNAGDVNGSGDVTAGDALDVLFSLRQSQLFDAQGMLVNAATVAPSDFRFYDPNEDGTSTAADALFVINILFLQSLAGSAEGESAPVQSAWIVADEVDMQRELGTTADTRLSSRTEVMSKSIQSQSAIQSSRRVEPSSIAETDNVDSDSNGAPDNDLSELDNALATVWDWIV